MGVNTFNVASLSKVRLMEPKSVGYEDSIEIIRDELQRTRRSFVKIGWYLKHIKDEEMFKEDGYADIFELAMDKFNISQPTANRFMNICEEFSVNHDSPELDEKFVNFSVSQLFEMLPMDEEKRKQITPDMTVKQIRGVKEETRKKKEPDDGEIRDVCYDCLRDISDEDFAHLKEYMHEIYGKYYHYHGDSNLRYLCSPKGIRINDSDEITWASFAKRAYALNDLMTFRKHKPEDDDQLLGQTSIEKDFPEYLPETEKAKNDCQPKLQEAVNEVIAEADLDVELPEAQPAVPEIIEGDYREISEPPEEELAEKQPEQAQPELPIFKNSDQRKAWLEDYKAWGLWYYDEHIDVNYYKYDFSDGSRLIVSEYPQREKYWVSKQEDEYYYHLLEKGKKRYGLQSYDEKYRYRADSKTELIEFLKDLQTGKKAGKRDEKAM